MRSWLRFVPALACVLLSSPTSATVFSLNTADHPTPSTFTLVLEVAATPFFDTLGPTPAVGTMTADISLSEPNDDGTINITASGLLFDDIGPQTMDLGPFGTLDLEFDDVEFELVAGPLNVTGNSFTISANTPGYMGFVGGFFRLTNATGFIASALGTSDPDDLDFGADPEILDFADLGAVTIAGLTDDDGGLADGDGAEVSVNFSVPLPVDAFVLRLNGNFNFGTTAVPEAGTWVMMSLGAGAAAIAGYIRRRRSL